MRALVTGATGKIGNAVARQLAERGDEVVAVVRNPAKARELLPSGVELSQGDVSDPASLRAAAAGIDAAFNCMGLFEQWFADPGVFDRINAEGARNLYAAAVAARVRLFVHMSSAAVYGPPQRANPFREDDACKPITPYQVTKFEAEEALSQIDPKETRLNILRPPGIYGPGSLLEIAVYNKVLTRRWSIELSGGIIVHPTYVGDVVEAIIALVEEPAPPGTVFNLGGERPILLRALRALIAEMLGVSRRSIVLPASIAGPFGGIAQAFFALMGRPRPLLAEMSRGHCFSSAVDDRRFRERYPAVPVTHLADGLREHIDWAREQHLLERPPRAGGPAATSC
jgi:nucleoside-diphosphate-sugar epimerase